MPSESDRPIEKLMRDYSAGRKAAADPDEFELHPVTRNSLKVELVKEYGRKLPGERAPSLWSTLWPKLAMAGGGVFIVAILVVILLPSNTASENDAFAVAKNETSFVSSSDQPFEDPALTSSLPSTSAEVFSDVSVATQSPMPRSDSGEVFQLHPAKRVPPPKPKIANEAAPLQRTPLPRLPMSKAPVRERRMTPVAAEVASGADSVSAESPAQSTQRVLSTFQFRVNGDEVVFIDEDQSRYTGTISAINPSELMSLAASSYSGLPRDSTDPQFADKYRLYSTEGKNGGISNRPVAGRFVVVGTNLTSRQAVRFSGNMLTWVISDSGETTSNNDSSVLLQIQGTATVGGDAPLSINATTEPQP